MISIILRNRLFVPAFLFALLILLATMPFYAPPYTIILMIAIFMYVILTVSWVIFSGPTGYTSLAPAAFFGVGIYTAAILGKTIPLPLMIFAGAAFSFILALITGALTLRLKGIYFAIFTFGLVILIQQFLLWWEITFTHTRGRFVVLVDNNIIFYVLLTIFVVLTITHLLLRRSKFGLALKSIGQDEEAAAQTGVNVTLLKIMVFAVSALFMGATGAIMATRWTYVDPYIAFNMNYSFFPVLMAIFGGTGQIYGPFIGGVILAYLEELLLTRFQYFYMLVFGIILITFIVFLPDGLVGLIQRWRKGGCAQSDAHTSRYKSQ